MNGLGREEQTKKDKRLLFTKETLGVVIVLFATLCLICLITREMLFSVIGQAVNAFLFGCFGFFAYAVIIFALGWGILLIGGKKIGVPKTHKALITVAFLLFAVMLQIATVSAKGLTFGEYLSVSYAMGEGGIATTSASGFFSAIIAYAFCALLTSVGSCVVLGVGFAIACYALIKSYLSADSKKQEKQSKFRTSFVQEDLGVEIAGEKDYPADDVDFQSVVANGKQKLFVNNPEEFTLKTKKEINKEKFNTNSIKLDVLQSGLNVVSVQNPEQQPTVSKTDDYKQKLEYIKTPTVIDMEKYSSTNYYGGSYIGQSSSTRVSGYVSPSTNSQTFEAEPEQEIPFIEHQENQTEKEQPIVAIDSATARAHDFEQRYVDVDMQNFSSRFTSQGQEESNAVQENGQLSEQFTEHLDEDIPMMEEPSVNFNARARASLFETEGEAENETEKTADNEPPVSPSVTTSERVRSIFFDEPKQEQTEETQSISFTSRVSADDNGRSAFAFREETRMQEPVVEEPPKPAPPINREYFRPPFDLLESYIQAINGEQENHAERMEIIKRTLEEFKINAQTEGYVQGPSITRYEVMMPAGISVKSILKYDDDLKMRLSAVHGVRIEAPIPGKNLVGIEVANKVKVTVGLKEVMEKLAEKKFKQGSLIFALGKNIVGEAVYEDLTKAPHYLIAGATGSGKSVCLHVMIVSMLMRYSPEELKLVLIDPKCVEFRKYEHLPHLLVDEIITEPKRAISLLQWAYDETNRRNDMFTECGGHISNIDDYNSMVANDKIAKLPRIVFVIDELADLMEACKKDLEEKIRRIAAKSRSAGIHLVLATQRPSVDVITGTIKANLPARIGLKVMTFGDSQTILSEAGAEKLLGNGDMLYKNSSMPDSSRCQGSYISGREISNIVEYIKDKNVAYYDDDIVKFLDNETKPKVEESASSFADDGVEKLDNEFINAVWFAVTTGTVSISSLQRRFGLGWPKAGGYIDKMEQKGFISGYDGSRARKVLITKEDFIARFGPRDEIG